MLFFRIRVVTVPSMTRRHAVGCASAMGTAKQGMGTVGGRGGGKGVGEQMGFAWVGVEGGGGADNTKVRGG